MLESLKYGDITSKSIKAGFKVHDYFGPGFPEIVYKRGLIIELEHMGVNCFQEVEKQIFYRNELIYKRKVDILVEEKILIEVKAIKELDAGDVNQILNYLKVYKVEVGLLMNFGQRNFFFKRYVLNNFEKL
jgi:GxxExxY protein